MSVGLHIRYSYNMRSGKDITMSSLQLTSNSFDEAISNGRVLVDFWAGWCLPCRMVSPIIEELAEEYGGAVKIAKVDVDNESALAARYEILSIPTVILFDDGIETKRFVGVMPKESYASELAK